MNSIILFHKIKLLKATFRREFSSILIKNNSINKDNSQKYTIHQNILLNKKNIVFNNINESKKFSMSQSVAWLGLWGKTPLKNAEVYFQTDLNLFRF